MKLPIHVITSNTRLSVRLLPNGTSALFKPYSTEQTVPSTLFVCHSRLRAANSLSSDQLNVRNSTVLVNHLDTTCLIWSPAAWPFFHGSSDQFDNNETINCRHAVVLVFVRRSQCALLYLSSTLAIIRPLFVLAAMPHWTASSCWHCEKTDQLDTWSECGRHQWRHSGQKEPVLSRDPWPCDLWPNSVHLSETLRAAAILTRRPCTAKNH